MMPYRDRAGPTRYPTGGGGLRSLLTLRFRLLLARLRRY